jgi:hypothetical protein
MTLFVRPEQAGSKLHRLLIFHEGKYIGEYEKSQDADIERKTAEIHDAESILLEVFNKYGEFCVRWDSKERKKSVRVNGVEVTVIPKSLWKTPSWQSNTSTKPAIRSDTATPNKNKQLILTKEVQHIATKSIGAITDTSKLSVGESMSRIDEICKIAVKCRKCFAELSLFSADFDIAQPRWIGPEYWSSPKRIIVVMLNPGSGVFRADNGAAVTMATVKNYSTGKASLNDVFSTQRVDMEYWGINRRFLNYFEESLRLSINEIGFLNLAWCATKNNSYPPAMLESCFNLHGVAILRDLKPQFIIMCGSNVHGFSNKIAQVVPDCKLIPTLHYAHREGMARESIEAAKVIAALK